MKPGPPKGVRFGGRQKGTPNKATLKRAEIIAAETKKGGRKLFVEILDENANQCQQLALAYAPHRDRAPDDKFPPDERKFEKYMAMSTDAAGKGVAYQTPKLQSTTLRHDAPTEPIKVEIEIVEMLKLTDRDGMPIYFRIEAIELVRPVVLGESKGANAGVVVSAGTYYVKERPDAIAAMCNRGE